MVPERARHDSQRRGRAGHEIEASECCFTCYNDPLGWDLQSRDELLGVTTVGSFHQIAFDLPGMPALEIPDDADGAWWDDVANRHLVDHWDDVTARFDTIVVDEAQDFRPEWITMLERLLDPEGPARMLMVADWRR